MEANQFVETFGRLRQEVAKAVVGQEELVLGVIVGALAATVIRSLSKLAVCGGASPERCASIDVSAGFAASTFATFGSSDVVDVAVVTSLTFAVACGPKSSSVLRSRRSASLEAKY